jgi:predicted TIM-barrel fold metal-dependent hydrolase
MADQKNLEDIDRLVEKYPDCNFILAHCGRCFIPPNMEDTLKHLPAAQNLWMDTSAVCDIGVFIMLLEGFDRSRILFGTDLVTASGMRGTYIRMGMQWQWVTAAQLTPFGGKPIEGTFAAYESVCALLYAARFCKLRSSQMNDIFYNNAKRLFNLI